eukprot:8857957-Pyramimonas_sp.AAC.1
MAAKGRGRKEGGPARKLPRLHHTVHRILLGRLQNEMSGQPDREYNASNHEHFSVDVPLGVTVRSHIAGVTPLNAVHDSSLHHLSCPADAS